jgi:hypothetical protein
MVYEEFNTEPSSRWSRYLRGGGRLELTGHSLRFVTQHARSSEYADAQIDDYQGLSRRHFPWRPPLRLAVRARFSHPSIELIGTAGFGFWNDPFVMTGRRLPTLPRAIWFFFASSPSDIKLDLGVPGYGWKAATIDARQWRFFLLLPTAPLAIPLMRLGRLYRLLWPLAQRAIGVRESLVEVDMTEWHTYVIEWGVQRARFEVDDQTVLDCVASPRGPLGFVMWLDNQYAVVTPWGRFGFGLLETSGIQWMEIETMELSPSNG